MNLIEFQPNAMTQFIQENSVSKLVKEAKEYVENGNDPLLTFQAFKLFADAFDLLNKDENFKSYVMSEASKHISSHHSEKIPAMFNGYKMFWSTNVQTDFDDIMLAQLKADAKERENYLKSLHESVFDEESGEVLAQPPTYRTKTVLVCKKLK